MKGHRLVPLTVVVIAILFTATGFADETEIQGVSPGASGRLAGIGSTCPTFTWESVAEAQRYGLVVYRLDPATMGADSLRFTTENEVLYTSISGRASAWTPESSDCFLPGESYVWFIRAVFDPETGEGSEWSQPRFFEVAAAPSVEELERAIEVIRRWEAATGAGLPTLSSDAAIVPDTGAGTDTASKTVDSADSGAGVIRPKSVVSGTAAIRGEQPDFSGETYGVVGVNASPDGAGIGAANITGGPDLVLDGTVPAEFTEAGIDRPSASPQTFSFFNTGGGGLTLDIDGVDVVTTATDRDTVGSLSCGPGELPKWNGASWTCAPDLDTDTDTLSGLSCDSNQIAKWVAGDWVCADDDDTVYGLGNGLVLVGDEIQIDSQALTPQTSTIDDSGSSISSPSVAIGNDGYWLIAYNDFSNKDLKVAHCGDASCSTTTLTTLDSSGDTGFSPSLVFGSDNLALIAYNDQSSFDLRIAHCDDSPCSTATISTVDSTGSVGYFPSAALGSDGLGLIAYYSFTDGALKVAHCDNVVCSSATISVIDAADDSGWYPSLAIGTDGLGLISYRSATAEDLKVAHCNDVACTSATISTLDSTGDTGWYTSTVIGSDGFGLISYNDLTNRKIKTAHCQNLLCSSAAFNILDDSFAENSAAIQSNGLPLIVYRHETEHELRTARCGNPECSSSFISTALQGTNGPNPAVSVAPDGSALIAFVDNDCLNAIYLPFGY